jgi:spermidine synthase
MSRREAGSSAVRRETGSGVVELVADRDRRRAWTLLVDGAPQSHVDLDDPRHLEFGYMRQLGHLIDLMAANGEPLRVLHLGGGGLTLARYVAATRPGSSQLAVEADAALAELVRERLPLDQPPRRRTAGAARTGAGRAGDARAGAGPAGAGAGRVEAGWAGAGRVRVRVADARAALDGAAAGSFDLVIADLFEQGRTPARLTSAEFTAAAARALAPGGVFAVNISDGPPLTHARARVATVRSVFARACLMADASVLRGRGPGNLVLAASAGDLPLTGLARRLSASPVPARLTHGAELDRFIAGARVITASDDDPAPAARLAAPPGPRGPL